ncbi:UbiA family prenyltransferase [Flavitalea sp.]|nr:UbiA family prenyltransferase [Flavitalea sp.]
MRGLVKSSIHFLVFSSIYIAVCALVMIYQTNQLLNLQYDVFHYCCFVFFSTICSYNFHWGLTPSVETNMVRLGWTIRNKTVHKILFIIGVIGAVWYFFYFTEHWFWLGIGVILTFLYSAPKVPYLRILRNIAVGKTVFLAMVWMYVTTALPIFISGKNWDSSQILFCASRLFFIYSICILFDYRDRDYDKKEGIRSMITYLDNKGVDKLFYFSLSAFAIITFLLVWCGFTTLQVVLILLPGLIMIPLYYVAKKNFSDYLYYIILDGMMMLSALLTSIFI